MGFPHLVGLQLQRLDMHCLYFSWQGLSKHHLCSEVCKIYVVDLKPRICFCIFCMAMWIQAIRIHCVNASPAVPCLTDKSAKYLSGLTQQSCFALLILKNTFQCYNNVGKNGTSFAVAFAAAIVSTADCKQASSSVSFWVSGASFVLFWKCFSHMITVSAPPAWCISCTHPLLGHIAIQSIAENFGGEAYWFVFGALSHRFYWSWFGHQIGLLVQLQPLKRCLDIIMAVTLHHITQACTLPQARWNQLINQVMLTCAFEVPILSFTGRFSHTRRMQVLSCIVVYNRGGSLTLCLFVSSLLTFQIFLLQRERVERAIQQLPKFRLKSVVNQFSACPICLDEFEVDTEVCASIHLIENRMMPIHG